MTITLAQLRERARDPRPILEAIGLLMVGRTQRAFSDQGRGGVAWLPRAVPNKAGVLEDLRAGKTPPERRWEPRPAGLDTGRLRSSIAYRVAGRTVEVGSNLPYASDVQRGATKTITLDQELRSALAAWLRSLSGGRKRLAHRAFGFLFHTGVLRVTTPPRPFVMVTDQDRRDIRALVARYFRGGDA